MVMYIVLSTQEKQEIVKKMGPRLRGVNSEARANAGSRSRGPDFLPAAKPRRSMDHNLVIGGGGGVVVLFCLLGKFCGGRRSCGSILSPGEIL